MKKEEIQVTADGPMVTDVFSWLACLIQNQEAGIRLMQQQTTSNKQQ